MRGSVSRSHLERRAFVYVRQSTTMQVFEHVESKNRQYGLAERAKSLGWSASSIEIIDEDQGKSGATTEGRRGFARVAHAVAHGEAGAIFALEVSRLARCSEDWQRLMSLCAVAGVVVVDEQSIYDPSDKDDKLLLDLKGTMSEAELHWLGLRLQGARRHKARRGELWLNAPTGYVWGDRGFELDPDESVQRAIRAIFERFAVEPSAYAVVRWANEVGVKFPTRRSLGGGVSEIEWKPLKIGRLSSVLHNPVYAGAYVFGRRPTKKVLVDGQVRTKRSSGSDPKKWWVKLEDRHPPYIDWETYVSNQQKLRNNVSQMHGATSGAPREGAALLTGLLICGRCGRRMRTDYASSARRRWSYVCFGEHARSLQICWSVSGRPLDAAVETLFLETMVPEELDVSLAVEHHVASQADALAEQWKVRLEQARYEARRAERRYKSVDPDNRVVARTLEREWEQKLRELEEIEQQQVDARRTRHAELSDDDRARIRALARDLPALWRAPTTHAADRKAMLRLVIEAIALSPIDLPHRETFVRVQWQSGNVTELRVARPSTKAQPNRHAVARVRALAALGHHDVTIAEILHRENVQTTSGRPWTTSAVRRVRHRHAIASTARGPRQPRALPLVHPTTGRHSIRGAAAVFGVSAKVIRRWIDRGLVEVERAAYAGYDTSWLKLDSATRARLRRLVTHPAH